MSFDLFAYIGEQSQNKLLNWQQCLINAGIECTLPNDLDFSDKSSEFPVKCKLYFPLAEKDTFVDDCEFLIEPMPVDKDVIKELIDGTNDKNLIKKIKLIKYECVIDTFEENEDIAMKIKCFVTATLANAFDGVLCDPQEFGAVHGPKVYEVARYYCSFFKPQPTVKTTTPKQPNSLISIKSVLYFVLVFIALIFIGDLLDFLYRLIK